jgi:anthraniloyl-CoA monooxygenase
MRYPREIFDAVRAVWPDERPISVRISATDWAPGGFTADDAVMLARALKARDCDVVDVSAGQVVSDQEPEYGRLFQTPFSDQVRLEADVPTMTVGNISSYEDVNSILAAGRADLCVLARAHLYDPYWTRHAATDLDYPLRWPDQYSSIQQYTPRFKS